MVGRTDRTTGRRHAGALCVAALALSLGVLSCAPPGGRSASQETTSAAAGSKVLRIGMFTGEPTTGIALFGAAPVFARGSIGGPEHTYALHAGLTVYNDRGDLLPRIAQKVPTIEDGDWRVAPDGGMEVTWKLRTDVKWHDGTPATAADFAFGVEIIKDRELPIRGGEAVALITDAVAPDPHTLIVRWRAPYVFANASGPNDIPAVPVHLMREPYSSLAKEAFANSAYWRSEFVGLGPYRLGDWVPGAHLEALAFDEYFLGRPRIDRVVFVYVSDANVLYVNVLSNEVDMTTLGSFQVQHFLLFKQEWEPTGAGTAMAVFAGSRNYRFQFRYPDAPWMDRRVRRALIHMLDRQELADVLFGGFSNPANTVASPREPVYLLAEERGLPKYPFDLTQAQRLMTEAGWSRGPDGTYRSAAGQPLSIELRVGDSTLFREAQAIAGHLKVAGVELAGITTGGEGEARYAFQGVVGAPLRNTLQDLDNFTTGQFGSEANRWMGRNRGSYSNPEYDRLYSQSLVTLNPTERQSLVADLLRLEAEDVASIHLYYDMARQTIVVRKGVTGPGIVPADQLATTWNIHTWDVTAR